MRKGKKFITNKIIDNTFLNIKIINIYPIFLINYALLKLSPIN